jgi:hypothetical protein
MFKNWFKPGGPYLKGRHNTLHNGIQCNDIQNEGPICHTQYKQQLEK